MTLLGATIVAATGSVTALAGASDAVGAGATGTDASTGPTPPAYAAGAPVRPAAANSGSAHARNLLRSRGDPIPIRFSLDSCSLFLADDVPVRRETPNLGNVKRLQRTADRLLTPTHAQGLTCRKERVQM